MTIQEQLNQVQEELSNLDSNNRGDLPEISRLTTLQNELVAQQALQERVQVQEQEIESIVLPEGYDFDEISGVENMNLMIIEVIKDFQRQYNLKRNAEEELMINEHKAQVAELKAANDSFAHENEKLMQLTEELNKAISTAHLELTDALSKRDAAVREKEGLEVLLQEKQAHIDTLRNEIAVGAKAAINVTNITPSDRLAQLVQESKNAKVKSALDIALENTAPFRGKVSRDGESVANLETPQVMPFPIVDTSSNTSLPVVSGPTSEDTTGDQVTPPSEEGEVQALSTGLAESDAGTVGESAETLEQRVKRLELHVFGV